MPFHPVHCWQEEGEGSEQPQWLLRDAEPGTNGQTGSTEAPVLNPHTPSNPGQGVPVGSLPWPCPPHKAAEPKSVPHHYRAEVPMPGWQCHGLALGKVPRLTEAPSLREPHASSSH